MREAGGGKGDVGVVDCEEGCGRGGEGGEAGGEGEGGVGCEGVEGIDD